MKSSFLRKAEQTMETLKKCKFVVKESKTGDWNIYCKSIIIAGPLPIKGYADLLASDLNRLVTDVSDNIFCSLELAEDKLKAVLNEVEESVGEAISGDSKSKEKSVVKK